jgi:hypothetical protein
LATFSGCCRVRRAPNTRLRIRYRRVLPLVDLITQIAQPPPGKHIRPWPAFGAGHRDANSPSGSTRHTPRLRSRTLSALSGVFERGRFSRLIRAARPVTASHATVWPLAPGVDPVTWIGREHDRGSRRRAGEHRDRARAYEPADG